VREFKLKMGSRFCGALTSTACPPASPLRIQFSHNYPNPFNPTTTIRFVAPEKAFATIRNYDVAGRLVTTVLSAELPGGSHRVVWDGKTLNGNPAASGVYFYSLTAGGRTATRKMVLLR
jgi:hypothetical protein